jgi:predicted O-methyltransferase YrrM
MSLLRSDFDARCSGGSDIVGHLPYLHARAACGDARVLELGVRSGESTCAFLAATEAHGGHVWSIDINQPSVPPEWFDLPNWTFLLGDDMNDRIERNVVWTDIDVLFIDTSHRYQHTFDELTLYGPRVKSGGVILLHDTELEVAPESVQPEDKDYPVRRAVEDWCRPRFLVPEFREGWYGLGVVEVV